MLSLCTTTSRIPTARAVPVANGRRPFSVQAVYPTTGGSAMESLARTTPSDAAMRSLELCESHMSRFITHARKTSRPAAVSATNSVSSVDMSDEEEEEFNPMDTLCICFYDDEEE